MEFHYLVRRARWLEKRLAGTDASSSGHVFDLNEYKELREAFPKLGVKYAAEAAKPVEEREERGEVPPLMGETFIPGAGARSHSRYPVKVADERRYPGRFIPGGL